MIGTQNTDTNQLSSSYISSPYHHHPGKGRVMAEVENNKELSNFDFDPQQYALFDIGS